MGIKGSANMLKNSIESASYHFDSREREAGVRRNCEQASPVPKVPCGASDYGHFSACLPDLIGSLQLEVAKDYKEGR